MDYYEMLQIDATATFDDIHKAYRSLALAYHPDRNSAPGSVSMMSSINEAYAVLSEPAKREAMMSFLEWMLTSGQRQCSALGYAPLPKNLLGRELERVNALKSLPRSDELCAAPLTKW